MQRQRKKLKTEVSQEEIVDLVHEKSDDALKQAIDASLESYELEERKRKVPPKQSSDKCEKVTLKNTQSNNDTNQLNHLSEPQLFYRLNYLPEFSTKINEGTIKITDIIQTGAQKAVLTTYKLELDWLFKVCPVLNTIPVFISHGEDSLDLQKPVPQSIKLSKPRTNISYSINHGKIILLEYADRLRVAISTANLIEIDYIHKTQGLWVQDFPLLRVQNNNNNNNNNNNESNKVQRRINNSETSFCEDFKETLQDYLKRLGIDKTWLDLNKYDFSRVKVVLITSVPGYHKGETMHKYGHLKLRRILGQERLDALFKDSSFICQISSIGSLSEKWLREFLQSLSSCAEYTSGTTQHHIKEEDKEHLLEPTSQSKKSNIESSKKRFRKSDSNNKSNLEESFKIVWPTVEFVRESIDGYASGGSLCFSQKNMKPFLAKYFHHYIPQQLGRNKIPPHIKTVTRANNQRLAWVLLTSANLSKAAWGELQKDGTQFMIRNFEIGVLFLPSLAEQQEKEWISAETNGNTQTTHQNEPKKTKVQYQAGSVPSLISIGEDSKIITFPLPYVIPPKKYELNDRPWIWDVQYKEPDILGNFWYL